MLWRKGNPCALWWKCKMAQPPWKPIGRPLKTLKIELHEIYHFHLGLFIERNRKQQHERKLISTHTFIAALFIILKTWKQHKCPVMDKLTKKTWIFVLVDYSSKYEYQYLQEISLQLFWQHTKKRFSKGFFL